MKRNGKEQFGGSTLAGHINLDRSFNGRKLNIAMEEWLRKNENGYREASWNGRYRKKDQKP